MNFAVRFKTGYSLSDVQQNEKIEETLKILGLKNCDNFVRDLSGGQKKRLSIAVEILHDPKIIFLDEPTTGLDTFSATQCLTYLRDIAKKDNRTIVITIHQPSARHVEMFDRIYAICDGKCAYQGTSKNLVPYLKKCNLVCPSSYNPCDFMLEVLNNDYGLDDKLKLIEQNNNCDNREFLTEQKSHETDISSYHAIYSLSFWQQLKILLKRNFILMNRDKTYLRLRIIVSMLISLLLGSTFFQIGKDASGIISNFKNVTLGAFFITYTGYYSLMTRCE
jgi:ABC-type multidrug transport system ATPase subunit